MFKVIVGEISASGLLDQHQVPPAMWPVAGAGTPDAVGKEITMP